jgi:hypothetical protein
VVNFTTGGRVCTYNTYKADFYANTAGKSAKNVKTIAVLALKTPS